MHVIPSHASSVLESWQRGPFKREHLYINCSVIMVDTCQRSLHAWQAQSVTRCSGVYHQAIPRSLGNQLLRPAMYMSVDSYIVSSCREFYNMHDLQSQCFMIIIFVSCLSYDNCQNPGQAGGASEYDSGLKKLIHKFPYYMVSTQ